MRAPARFRFLLAAGLAALLLSAPAFAQRYFPKGQTVVFAGAVTDAEGRPLGGVTVLLELVHSRFHILAMERKVEGPVQIPATTGEDGRYRLEWDYDPYHNVIGLAVALPVNRAGVEDFEILLRRDVTSKLTAGEAALDVPLVIEEPGYLLWLQSYLAGEASEDEKRLFRELGKPDRLDREERRGRLETGWWYFEEGKVYRFEDGRLERVIPFEPVD